MTVFVLSSVVSIITLWYIGVAFRKHGSPAKVPYHLFLIFIPLAYGIFGVLNYYVIQNFGYRFSFLVGMLFGLILSIIGRFGLDLPTLIFDFTRKTEYHVHIYAIVLYAGIFQLVLTPLTKLIVKLK
jgi:hypothetical protein